MHTVSPSNVLIAGQLLPAREVRFSPALFQVVLGKARNDHGHALCMCRHPKHLKLQIRERSQRLHLAAWPDQAYMHAVSCPFYSEKDAYSRRGAHHIAVAPDGASSIRLNKPLSYNGKTHPAAAQTEPAENSVKLWSLLHHLWEMAGINRWHPGWRRDWGFARHALSKAADNTRVNEVTLGEILYIPPTFEVRRKEAIQAGWNAFLKPLQASHRGSSSVRAGFLLGVVRAWEKSDRGTLIYLRHHADSILIPSALADSIATRCRRGWGALHSIEVEQPPRRVVFLARVESTRAGLLVASEAVLMLANKHLIPCANEMEIQVADALVASDREFIRPLSFDQSQGSLPSFVLRDFDGTGVFLTEMFCLPRGFSSLHRERLQVERGEHAMVSGHGVWFWVQEDSDKPPPFPQPQTPREGRD